MAKRLLFNDTDHVGVFCKLTNTYCLVGEGSDDFYSEVVAKFEDIIPVIKTSIAGTSWVGRYCIGNKNGLLLPHTTTPEEYQHIKRSLPHATVVRRIPEGLTCYARFIACNDHVAFAHTDLHQEVEELLNDVLKVEVFKPKKSCSFISGTYCALSNIGGLIHPNATTTKEVLDELSENLEVPFEAGTVNDGSETLFPGITVNDWTGFCGSTTTSAELHVINRVFKLRKP
ncbi:eukaryotic translation initiation factor 6-2 isoform X1 [Lathyrus oleraceus]|uniref:Eukaryotic translation initiation factor 6 n=1 Tax=Pisum sativum TaxID=3888 RepID=A0A9D5ARH3_PEA|nr:eukaryotic translation initiation factor 6-2-like isoform X1 [Pisum sativum]XP_050870375.1 eukaryotic translation initiation factor 6-2-like isoform X1 [Pisum sativum]KAI5415715.1 hypothetical protein KIW84_040938 [Pisum sativum]